jgi:hypothetical protein
LAKPHSERYLERGLARHSHDFATVPPAMRTLQRYLGWAAVPNLSIWLIALQVVGYVSMFVPMRRLNQLEIIERMTLYPDRVLAGEWWRVFTFLCFPPLSNPVFAFFIWWFFHLMGTYLENYWGTFRFNLYVWIWWLATVAMSLATQSAPPENYLLQQSIFLAFARLLPEFVIYIFWVLPIQARWVAWLTWLSLIYTFCVTDWGSRGMLLAALANYLLYFATEIYRQTDSGRRRVLFAAKYRRPRPAFRHQCVVCGATDQSHPDAEFRYCSQCAGQACYCDAHVRDHEHLEEAEADDQS